MELWCREARTPAAYMYSGSAGFDAKGESFAVKTDDNVAEGSAADAIALAAAVAQDAVGKREAENGGVVDGNDVKHTKRVALEATGVASFTSPRRSSSSNAKQVETRHQSSPAIPGVEGKLTSSVGAAADPDSTVEEQDVKPSATSNNDAMTSKMLGAEKQKIALQQKQVKIQRRELVAEESMRKQAVRAEVTTKLVLAGKSLAEVKEFLALLG